MLKSTSISGKSAWLVGGRCGWIVNHSFVIGGGGYGLASDIPASKENDDFDKKDTVFVIEPTVNGTLNVTIGSGSAPGYLTVKFVFSNY